MLHNVDQHEIAKFGALAKNWWDLKGPMKPLHALNPLRLSYIQKHAEIQGKSVIDMGCGGGILTESLARAGAIVTGIDMGDDVIHVAKQHAEQSALSIHYEQIRSEDFAKMHLNQFDVVTCMEMLEHVPDPNAIIQAAAQLVKPNGLIFFSTINRNIKAFLEAIIGAEYILNLLPKGTHHYRQFIRPSELTASAEKNNLALRNMQGITYHLLNNQFSFTDTVSTNYLMVFQLAQQRELKILSSSSGCSLQR